MPVLLVIKGPLDPSCLLGPCQPLMQCSCSAFIPSIWLAPTAILFSQKKYGLFSDDFTAVILICSCLSGSGGFFFLPHQLACGILVSQAGNHTCTPCSGSMYSKSVDCWASPLVASCCQPYQVAHFQCPLWTFLPNLH